MHVYNLMQNTTSDMKLRIYYLYLYIDNKMTATITPLRFDQFENYYISL